MKKILSLGVAAAVVSLTAVAASAAITPAFVDDAVSGETVTVEVVASGLTQTATTFTVVASDNLTLTEAVKGSVDGFAEFNQTTGIYAWAGSDVLADGTVLLTLTYSVDAAADEEVSVKLVPDAGFTDISADPVAVVVVDGASVDVPPASDDVFTTDDEGYTTDDNGGIIDDVTSDEAGSSDNGGDNGDNTDDNPITGVGLAVVPAVLAGAAIVVAKKRK